MARRGPYCRTGSVLVAALAAAILGGAPAAASAPLTVAPDPYPLAFHSGDPASETAAWGNCTWWAWNLWWENFHLRLPGLLGNGGQWGASLAQAGYTAVPLTGGLPKGINPVGALAWWAPTAQDSAGHVGLVIGYQPSAGTITVSYSNWSGADGADWGTRTLLGVAGIAVDGWTSTYPLQGPGAPTGLVLPPATTAGRGLFRTAVDNGGTAQAVLLGTDPLPHRWQLVPGEPFSATALWQNIGSAPWGGDVAMTAQGLSGVVGQAVSTPLGGDQAVALQLTGAAPTVPGVYPLTVSLTGAGGPFGVRWQPTLYVSQDGAAVSAAPTVAVSGSQAAVSVSVVNTGTTTWVGKLPDQPYGVAGSGAATFASVQQYGLLRLAGPADSTYGDFVPLTQGVDWPSVDSGLNHTATLQLTLPLQTQPTTAIWQMADRYPNGSGGYTTVPFGPAIQLTLPAAADPPALPAGPAIQGSDRVATALAIAQALYPAGPPGGSVVLVAGGADHLVDGLAAAPLAHALGAPVLVAALGGGVDARVLAYLARWQVRRVYLVGALGNPANAPAVTAAVARADPDAAVVDGLTGLTRYGTAEKVAALVRQLDPGTTLFVAAGSSAQAGPQASATALLTAAAAAYQGAPLVLVAPNRGVPANLLSGVTRTVVVGPAATWPTTADLPGRQVVGSGAGSLPALSQEMAAMFFAAADEALEVSASPAHLVDALAAGPLAAGRGAPVLMATRTDSSAVAAWQAAHPQAPVTAIGWAATYRANP